VLTLGTLRRNVDLKIPQNAGEFVFLNAAKIPYTKIGSMTLQDLPRGANSVAQRPESRSIAATA
jgi:hypothetical protein